MKNPLSYQKTEYDCGPTTLMNAVSCLFEREDIPPEVIKQITLYSMDASNEKGELCKGGTSEMAMMFLANWLNQFGRDKKFPIQCEYLTGSNVEIEQGSRVVNSLKQGSVAVARVRYGCWHYVLLTGADDDFIYLFDPYYRERRFSVEGIKIISDAPMRMNRRVAYHILNAEGKGYYALGSIQTRETVLFSNTFSQNPVEKKLAGGCARRKS